MAVPDNACGIAIDELAFPEIIELNVGGQVYVTRYSTLTSVPDSLMWEMFTQKGIKSLARDTKGRFFIDRDGFLFRYILDYMRDQQLVLPDHFPERGRLQREAEFFNLPGLVKLLAPKISTQNSLGDDGCQSDPEESSPSADIARNLASLGATACSSLVSSTSDSKRSGFITIGYRGSYTLSRDSQTDAKFRRVARIMVCGKTSLAKEVFGEMLNESRDPDRPPERYTSRYYLKFTFLEQAFDRLADAGFHMVACNSTGTCAFAQELTEDKIWTSYTEYVFYRGKAAMVTCFRDPDIDGGVEKTMCGREDPDVSNVSSRDDTNLALDLHNESLSDPLPPFDISELPLPEELSPPPLPAVSPARPTTLPLKTHPRPTITNTMASTITSITKDNSGPPSKDTEEEEKKVMEDDLKKCIEDFRKIRIPKLFPDQKKHWQSDLLKKYNA